MPMTSKVPICKTCAMKSHFQDGSPGCSKFKIHIVPEEDYCSWHETIQALATCDICKKQFSTKDLVICYINDIKFCTICQECSSYMQTCRTCVHKNICGFANDTSEPPYVMRTIQQGMMTMQTQVKNPKLIIKHCQKCKCSDGADPSIRDIICFKEINGDGCPHWQIEQ